MNPDILKERERTSTKTNTEGGSKQDSLDKLPI